MKKRIVVTPVELFEIDENPKFVAQSRVNKKGEYIMVWKIKDKEYETHNKIQRK